jgi:hypothetical protein
MTINFHPHVLERMEERGTSEVEIRVAVEHGERFPAKFGRTGFRHNFHFESKWRNKHYHTKQIEVYAVEEKIDFWLVLTVITRYF